MQTLYSFFNAILNAVIERPLLAPIALCLLAPLVLALKRRPIRRSRIEFLARREVTDTDTWHAEFLEPLSLDFETSNAVAARLARIINCKPTQLRPDDPLRSRKIGEDVVGLCDEDEIEDLCEEFDAWMDTLDPIGTRCGTDPRGGSTPDVQTVADLIRWVEPFLSKKAMGAGLRDDDLI